jgi:hypothetical protein
MRKLGGADRIVTPLAQPAATLPGSFLREYYPMPDLSTAAVGSWFAQAAPRLDHLDAHAIRPIEAHECVADALVRLGTALDEARLRDPMMLNTILSAASALEILCAILTQLGVHRMARLMAWLGESPGGDAVIRHLLAPADQTGNAQILRATLGEIERQILVARLFGPDRLAALRAACDAEFAETVP